MGQDKKQDGVVIQRCRIPFAVLLIVAATMLAFLTTVERSHGDFASTARTMGIASWFQSVLLGTRAVAILSMCLGSWLIVKSDFRLVPPLAVMATLVGGLSSEFGRSQTAWVDWVALVTTWTLLIVITLVILICLRVIRPIGTKKVDPSPAKPVDQFGPHE